LFATKLNRNNGSIKYADIIEELPNGGCSHSQTIDIPLTEKEVEDTKIKEQTAN
jgi:hypothetical protein